MVRGGSSSGECGDGPPDLRPRRHAHRHARACSRVAPSLLLRLLLSIVALLAPAFGAHVNESESAPWSLPPLPEEGLLCPCTPPLGVRMLMLAHGAPVNSLSWTALHAGFFEGAKRVGALAEAVMLTTAQLQQLNGTTPGMLTILQEQYDRFNAELVFPHILVVSVPDAYSLRASLQRWSARGTKIITVNSDYTSVAEHLSLIGSFHMSLDDSLAGEQTGVRLAQAGVQRAVCVMSDLMTNGLRRCEGFVRGFLAFCSGSCLVERVIVSVARLREDLDPLLSNRSIDGIAIVAANVVMQMLPMLDETSPQADSWRVHNRRIAVFGGPDELTYKLLDKQILYFLCDIGSWAQGFLPAVIGGYLAQTGQLFTADSDPNFNAEPDELPVMSAVPTWIKTGPTFIAARTSNAGRVRPRVSEAHLDVLTHARARLIFDKIKSGVDLAARYLGLTFQDCTDGMGSCKGDKLSTVRYYAPDLPNNGATMSNQLNRFGEEGTHGVVSTVPSPAVLRDPLRQLVQAGIPLVTTNTGTDYNLGQLAHVGVSEFAAGKVAGRHAGLAGAVRMLCVVPTNLNDAYGMRCRGMRDGLFAHLNATRSPWLPTTAAEKELLVREIVLDLESVEAVESHTTVEQLLQKLLDLLASAPEINFVMALNVESLRLMLPALHATGRWNVSDSQLDPAALLRDADHPLEWGCVADLHVRHDSAGQTAVARGQDAVRAVHATAPAGLVADDAAGHPRADGPGHRHGPRPRAVSSGPCVAYGVQLHGEPGLLHARHVRDRPHLGRRGRIGGNAHRDCEVRGTGAKGNDEQQAPPRGHDAHACCTQRACSFANQPAPRRRCSWEQLRGAVVRG